MNLPRPADESLQRRISRFVHIPVRDLSLDVAPEGGGFHYRITDLRSKCLVQTEAVCSSHSTMQSVEPQLQRGTMPVAIKARSSGHPFASKTNDNEELLQSSAFG